MLGSTLKQSEEIKMVPEVPRLMLQPPLPTVPVPTAAAALSPAPAQTITVSGRPRARAMSGSSVPTGSQLSWSFGSCFSVIPQMPHISADQRFRATSRSSIPEASE